VNILGIDPGSRNCGYAIISQDNGLRLIEAGVIKIKEKRENVTLESIIKVVSKELNIKPSEIKSRSRSIQIANARRIVIYLARNLTPNSMPALAKFFGMKDHSSVSKAMKKIQETVENDADFKNIVEELKNKINAEEQNG